MYYYLYYLYAPEIKAIKIGISTNLQNRFKAIQGAYPGCLICIKTEKLHENKAREVEGKLHLFFRKYHIQGEWFKAEGELLEIVNQNSNGHQKVPFVSNTYFKSNLPAQDNNAIQQPSGIKAEEKLAYSIAECAARLGISKSSCYEMARTGQLPAIRCGQKRLIIPVKALLEKISVT